MNVATRPAMTMEQFLLWEERQERPWEFDGQRPVAMTGGTQAHALVQTNLVTALHTALRGTPCRVFASHLKLRLERTVRYPDAFVTCSPLQPNATWETEPVVIFEILSPSTAEADMVTKNGEYRGCASVQRYVILEQASRAALVFNRRGELWVANTVEGIEGVIEMPEIGVSLPLREIYADVPAAADRSGEAGG